LKFEVCLLSDVYNVLYELSDSQIFTLSVKFLALSPICPKGLRVCSYSTVQYSTVQYSTVQYSTVQYSTVQFKSTDKGRYRGAEYRNIELSVYLRISSKTVSVSVCSLPQHLPVGAAVRTYWQHYRRCPHLSPHVTLSSSLNIT
jgi:hypothetical protein